MSSQRVSRRDFLHLAAITTAGAALAACAPGVGTSSDATDSGASVSQASTALDIIVAGFVNSAWQVTERAQIYADEMGVDLVITPVPDGWETKALSQIEAGAPLWHGMLAHHPFRFSVQWLAQGLIMPLEDYMTTSSVIDYDTYWSQMIAPDLIRQDCSVKGQVVGIPVGIDTCCLGFNAELMERAGLPHTREDFKAALSWAQLQQWAEQLREEFRSENIWGITAWHVYHQSLGAIFQSITSDLYYEDEGLIRFDSEEMEQALTIQSNWAWSGAAPVPAWGQQGEAGQLFPGGRSALWSGQVGVVGTGRRALGADIIPNAVPVHVEGGTGGNQWYTTTGYVLNKSEYPQEVVDFYLWLLGPQNDENAQLTLNYNWFPIFEHHWDTLVDGNPEYEWAKDFLPQITNAHLIPRNPYYEIQWATAQKYSELTHAERMSVAEACQAMMDEVRQRVSEMTLEW